MRLRTRLGLGLLFVGCGLLLVSSGAFDSVSADRVTNLRTAEDEHALLGIDGPANDQLVFDPDNSLWCEQDGGDGYCLYVTEIMEFTDQTDYGLKNLDSQSSTSGDASFVLGWREGDISYGSETVYGVFSCPYRGQQRAASGDVSLYLTATGENLAINTTRTVSVECESRIGPDKSNDGSGNSPGNSPADVPQGAPDP